LVRKNRYPNTSVINRYNSLMMEEDQRWVVGIGVNLPVDFGKRISEENSLVAKQLALDYQHKDFLLSLRELLLQNFSYWQQAKEVHELYVQEMLPISKENIETAK